MRGVEAVVGLATGAGVAVGMGDGVGVGVGITRGRMGTGPLSSTGPSTGGVGVGLGGRVKSCGLCCADSGIAGIASMASKIAVEGKVGRVIIRVRSVKREAR